MSSTAHCILYNRWIMSNVTSLLTFWLSASASSGSDNWSTQSNIGRFHLSMQESAEKLTDTCKSHEMHCIYSKKHYFTPYRHADLTWHGTHQFHKEIWALAFEHRVVLLIQHNHNVSCLIARLLQAWELLGAVMIARLTCGFKSWTNMLVQKLD